MDRRDHQDARRREGRKPGGGADLPSFRGGEAEPESNLCAITDVESPIAPVLRRQNASKCTLTPRPPAKTCLPSSPRSRRRHARRRPRRSPSGPRGKQRLGRPMSTPWPIRSFSSPSRSLDEIGEHRRGGDGGAAGGGVLGQAARSRVKHPRLQVARLLARRHVARVEVDRVAAIEVEARANAAASGRACRRVSREASSTIRNGRPTENIPADAVRS